MYTCTEFRATQTQIWTKLFLTLQKHHMWTVIMKRTKMKKVLVNQNKPTVKFQGNKKFQTKVLWQSFTRRGSSCDLRLKSSASLLGVLGNLFESHTQWHRTQIKLEKERDRAFMEFRRTEAEKNRIYELEMARVFVAALTSFQPAHPDVQSQF